MRKHLAAAARLQFALKAPATPKDILMGTGPRLPRLRMETRREVDEEDG
jgi:hypothetical protein